MEAFTNEELEALYWASTNRAQDLRTRGVAEGSEAEDLMHTWEGVSFELLCIATDRGIEFSYA
jgi:hypothetical protein